jgi:NAD(P)-dependent dehydrogenase (short-subunit alcohol dehydrogenase family)
MMRLEGKTAIVTGGASGIGAATATIFAREGAAVVVADSNADGGDMVAQRITAAGGKAAAYCVDVTDLSAMDELMDFTIREFDGFSVMFNGAGVEHYGLLADTSLEDWERVIQVNLTGTFIACRTAVPRLRAQGKGGSIINMGSMASTLGFTGFIPYCASKGGVLLLTKAVALECAEDNIRVNAICPGSIDTPMHRRMLGTIRGLPIAEGEDIEPVRASLVAMHPMKRVGQAEEIALTALFLACDESSFTTGHALAVDGGVTAGPSF